MKVQEVNQRITEENNVHWQINYEVKPQENEDGRRRKPIKVKVKQTQHSFQATRQLELPIREEGSHGIQQERLNSRKNLQEKVKSEVLVWKNYCFVRRPRLVVKNPTNKHQTVFVKNEQDFFVVRPETFVSLWTDFSSIIKEKKLSVVSEISLVLISTFRLRDFFDYYRSPSNFRFSITTDCICDCFDF